MTEPWLSKRRFTWAPRTLAVISCALALLAAQPALHAAAPAKPRPVAFRDMGAMPAPASASIAQPEAAVVRSSRTIAGTDDSLFESARRLHILATVEILHRLLISELQPPECHVMPILWFQPVCIGIVATPSPNALNLGHGAWRSQPPPVTERVFAIEHCLLAPPVS